MSRPRSTPPSRSTPARGGAVRAGRPGVYVATPKSDIYVTLLSIALGAMVLSTFLLVLLMWRYDFKVAPC